MATNVYDGDNVILGEASRVLMIPYNGTVPTVGSTPSIGYTLGPITANIDVQHAYATADQATGPLQAHKTTEAVTIVIPLAEVSLQNIARTLGYAVPTAAATTFSFGNDRTTREWTLFLVGPAPDGDLYQWRLHRGVIQGTVNYAISKTDQTVVNLNVTLLLDYAAQSEAAQYFTVTKV